MKTIDSPHPQALQDKFMRIGWLEWLPTEGVTDEDTQIYLTYEGKDTLCMSVEEALALSDEEFEQRLWSHIGMPEQAEIQREARQA